MGTIAEAAGADKRAASLLAPRQCKENPASGVMMSPGGLARACSSNQPTVADGVMRRRTILADRAEAGRLLAERLAASGLADPVVLALPRGGVPVGAEIAKALRAPLGVAFVRKIGAPGEPELAVLVVRQSDGLPGQGWWVAGAKKHGYAGLWEGRAARKLIRKIQKRAFDYWGRSG